MGRSKNTEPVVKGGKTHFTVDGMTAVCARAGAKESSLFLSEVVCKWCLGRIKQDPRKYLVALHAAGAPKPVLEQLWRLVTELGDPVEAAERRARELRDEATLQESIAEALAKIKAEFQLE